MSTSHTLRFSITALSLAAATAFATDGHYREYVVGDRAGGMGGAALAVVSDVDAVFYNPAGLAHAEADSISLSANLYGLERYRTNNDKNLGVEDKSSSFVSIPGAFGGTSRLSDDMVAGFGVFTPKTEKRHLITRSRDNRTFTNYSTSDETIWIGPALGWAPQGSRFSFGAGVFGVYRDYSTSESFTRGGAETINGAMDIKAFGVLATIGAQIDLGDGWSAGTTFQTPSLRLWDDGVISISGTDLYDNTSEGIYSSDVRADNYIPLQLGLGIGRTVPDKWGFAFDATFHPSAHYDLARWRINGFDESFRIRQHSVVDLNLGGEYIVAERYPIRAGVYTAFSTLRVPDNDDSSDFSTSDVDIYGTTFSVGRRSKNVCVNVGFNYAFGHGHDQAYDAESSRTKIPCDRRVLLAIVSTTYYF